MSKTPDDDDALSVIALVGSAGGLEAITQVLSKLPPTLHAAVVVLVHQQPDRVSVLVEILGRHSALPLTMATDALELAPGTAVVAPAGSHILVAAGPTVRLIPSGAAPPSRPSADLLLTTLALTVGRRATVVVLSGYGHDGATGATAIHAFGGTVVATDETSSAVFSMPQATIERDGAIDHVVPLEDVAELLSSLVGYSAV